MADLRLASWTAALATAALLGCPGSCKADDVTRANLLGTWKLLSVETLRPNGEASHEWMGRHPAGLIVYDATGHVSLHIMRDPRPGFAPGHSCCIPERTATPEEIGAAYEGYYAYFGTFDVDERDGAVIHHVQGSLWPREVGRDYRRRVELLDGRLTLTTPPFPWGGEQRVNRLTWERVRQSER